MQRRQQILISLAIFVATMFGGAVNAQNPLYQINREIARTRHSIDSVRVSCAKMMAYQLAKNANYRYICEHRARVDTLPQENQRLINSAFDLIRKHRYKALLMRTPLLFKEYHDVPGVYHMGEAYRSNNRQIQEYKRRAKMLEPEYMMIKNRCDSIMHAQIDMYQLRLDSLLNRKIQLVR